MSKLDEEKRELAYRLGNKVGRIFSRPEAAAHAGANKATWSNRDTRGQAPNHYQKDPDAKGKARRYLYTEAILSSKDEKDWCGQRLDWPEEPQPAPVMAPLSAKEISRRVKTVDDLVENGWVKDSKYATTLKGT